MKKRGFTLIELIVVVAIIAILSTVIIVSYNGAQKKSRDSKRKADLNSIAAAMAIYYSDNKTMDLVNKCANQSPCDGKINVGIHSIAAYLVNHGYLSTAPKDPDTTQDYMYFGASSQGAAYAKLEATSTKNYTVDATWEGSTEAGAAGMIYGLKIKP